jgi:hypothetical protein
VVGESTVKASTRGYNFVELDRIAVKGKTKPETIYTVGEVDLVKHKQFLTNYYTGDWDKALDLAIELSQNSKLHEYYKLMSERLAEGCPAEWKGYYVATSK